MKRIIATAIILVIIMQSFSQSPAFNDYFTDYTMRVDYYQTGDSDEMYFSQDQIYKYKTWAGNPMQLIDNLNSGMYYVHVYDLSTNKLIYSRGFATLFGEYRTTTKAKNNIKKSYFESVLIPFPKSKILFVILGRNENNVLTPLFESVIDPNDKNIIEEKPDPNNEIIPFMINGSPHNKVDFVFVAEGYAGNEIEKFKKDVEHGMEVLFNVEPYKSNKDRFNISGVFRASAHSGIDQPTHGIFRKTVVSASYNALELYRYLLIDDTKSLRDIACEVPHDAVIVIANSTRYGGGGIYNNYSIYASDDERSDMLLLHEFGHGFANTADEYYGSTVAYNEFFPPGREPHEPNITLLLDKENIKWKDMLTPGIEIPTPWGQEEIEKLRKEKENLKEALQKKSAEGKKSQSETQKEYEQAIKEIDQKIIEIDKKYLEMYDGQIGVFEGAGYSSKGIYRSEVKIGFYREGEYNKVTQKAIKEMIDHLSVPGQSTGMASPPVIIYKTKKDYFDKVPVILSDDKSTIVSFPGKSDLFYKGEFSYPVELKEGYLLDRRGISRNVAFLSYTYEDYSKLEKTPEIKDLYESIIDPDPLLEMYKYDNTGVTGDRVSYLNELITNQNFDSFIKLR